MLRDILTEAELRALLGDAESGPHSAAASTEWDPEDRKLLQALVRNQLRLLHMIEEMQAELRLLTAIATDRNGEAGGSSFPNGAASQQIAVSLEPLPFLKSGTSAAAAKEESNEESVPELSRKERFKRKTIKSFW